MSLQVWVGVILASLVNVIYYSQLFPVYKVIRSTIFDSAILGKGVVPANLITMLDTTLNWGPLIVLIGVIFYAILASIFEKTGETWRAD